MSGKHLLGCALFALVVPHAVLASDAGIRTEAVCFPSYAWMNNTLGQSPCLVAAYLQAQCSSGVYNVIPIDLNSNPPMVYAPPAPSLNNTVYNVCACSWAVYNLLEACLACQSGGNYLHAWSSWQTNCGANLLSNDTFYPQYPPYVINPATAVPDWATMNPTDWSNGIFNITEAHDRAAEMRPDFTSVPHPKQKQTVSVGALAGGIVAAVVAVALIAVSVMFVVLRRKRKMNHAEPELTMTPPTPTRLAPSMSFSSRTRPFSTGSSTELFSPASTIHRAVSFALPPSPRSSPTATARTLEPDEVYTPDPLILKPIPEYPERIHSDLDTAMPSGNVVPMRVDRSSKDMSQTRHSPESSSSALTTPTEPRPTRYAPPPYTP